MGYFPYSLGSPADDLGLGQVDQRRANLYSLAFHSHLGRQIRETLEGRDEGGTAIGIAGVVHGVLMLKKRRIGNHRGGR